MRASGYISIPAYAATQCATFDHRTTMTGQASKRWLIHLPRMAYAYAVTHYGGEDKVRELLCDGLQDVIRALQNGELSQKQLSDYLALSIPPAGETTELVSLRVPYDADHEFNATLGVYGAKTAVMRELLEALTAKAVTEQFQSFVAIRRSVIVDILGGSRNATN